MKTLNIEELTAKTWNSSYPDRKKWEDISPDARAEWVRVFHEFESHRSEVDSDKLRANQLSDNVEFLVRAIDEMHLTIIGLTGIVLIGTWQERVSDVVNFVKAMSRSWNPEMKDKVVKNFKVVMEKALPPNHPRRRRLRTPDSAV